jgi:hypothetical protein
MKKLTSLLVPLFVLLIVCAGHIKAQDNMDIPHTGEARKGQFLLSAGVGFIEGVGANINVEYGLLGNRKTGALMVGLFGSIMWHSWLPREIFSGWPGADIDRNFYTVGFRTAYRYDLTRRFEIYVALWTGMIYSEDYSMTTIAPSSEKCPCNKYMWQGGGYLGFRYHFSNVVGLYVEGGYGIPIINAGFAFSF